MRPSIEVTLNGVPAGAFPWFIWRRDGRYFLRLRRIEVAHREPLAVARYAYLFEVEKHTGYSVVTVHLFGRSWLIYLGRKCYVQQIDQETEQ